MIKLIALTGAAHSGKSTLAKWLSERLSYEKYSFATPVKEAINSLFNWNKNIPKDQIDPKWGFSPRQAYQTFGTEWGRKMIRSDLWILFAQHIVEIPIAQGIVIDDLRFENEAQWVRQRGGLVVHVRRAGEYGINSAHDSEKGILVDCVDYAIPECDSIEALHAQTSTIISIVKYGRESV